MKYLSTILLGLALMVGCQPAGDNGGDGGTDGNTTAIENQESTVPVSVVKFSVPGITWAGCAASVREALTSCEGVQSVEVDPQTKVATAQTTAEFEPQKALNVLAADQRFVNSSLIE